MDPTVEQGQQPVREQTPPITESPLPEPLKHHEKRGTLERGTVLEVIKLKDELMEANRLGLERYYVVEDK